MQVTITIYNDFREVVELTISGDEISFAQIEQEVQNELEECGLARGAGVHVEIVIDY